MNKENAEKVAHMSVGKKLIIVGAILLGLFVLFKVRMNWYETSLDIERLKAEETRERTQEAQELNDAFIEATQPQ